MEFIGAAKNLCGVSGSRQLGRFGELHLLRELPRALSEGLEIERLKPGASHVAKRKRSPSSARRDDFAGAGAQRSNDRLRSIFASPQDHFGLAHVPLHRLPRHHAVHERRENDLRLRFGEKADRISNRDEREQRFAVDHLAHHIEHDAGTDLTTLQRPLVFFGDETSLSTAAAFHATDLGLRDVKRIFEADDVDATRRTLAALKLDATVLQRNEFATLDRTVLEQCRGAKDLMLTGKSPSIQRIYRAAKGLGLRKVKNVAYWSPGKKGLSGIQK